MAQLIQEEFPPQEAHVSKTDDSAEPAPSSDLESLESRPKALERINVEERCNKRIIRCFCDKELSRSIVPHIRRDHPEVWVEWVQHFVDLRSAGFPLKRIMRLYRAGNGPLLFSWTVIERAVRKAVESGAATYKPARIESIEQWEPDDFPLSMGTLWNFPRRGMWAVHSSDYRGNWPPS